MHTPKREFMQAAIDAAKKSSSPFVIHHIGSVVVKGNEIIAAACNQTKEANDSTMHAEIATIREASRILGERKLQGCTLYSTHEPCAMCTGALIWARLDGVVFGATLEDMLEVQDLHGTYVWGNPSIHIKAREILKNSTPKIDIAEEFMRDKCKELFAHV